MIKYLTIILVVAMAYSCNSTNKKIKSKYGIVINPTRKKNNLPLIDSSWIFTGNKKGVLSWQHPDLESILNANNSCYGKKQIYLKDGNLYQEIDHYYSGKNYTINYDGPDEYETKENIQVGYNYSDSTFFVNSECKFFENNPFPSISDVEELLHTWGLSRLNYR